MSDDVLFSVQDQLGIITLNRPEALNALTLPMIVLMQKQLDLWKSNQAIHAVVLKALSGKAFCAGGDVRWLYNAGKEGNPEQMQFFEHEYRLNFSIHQYPKPFISLMDGIVMGGGVGISLHGSHPVASERFIFAMPEATIGFFPDIGASHLLNRCPGSLGVYLALTGNRLGPDDARDAGLVRYIVSSEQMSALLDALGDEDLSENASVRVTSCLQHFASSAKTQSQINPLIDVCFSKKTVEDILHSLEASGDNWALGIRNELLKKAPLSLKIIMAQLHKTKGLSLDECLQIDYDLVGHFMRASDFYEGVRAVLVDKDQSPKWQPKTLDAVTDALVISYFERI